MAKAVQDFGEKQATNAMIFGPLFASLAGEGNGEGAGSPLRQTSSATLPAHAQSVQNSSPFSAPHRSRGQGRGSGTLPSIYPRKAHSVSEIFRKNKRKYNVSAFGEQKKKKPYVKKSVLKVERRKYLYEKSVQRRGEVPDENEKVLYANPQRYETASEREFKSATLLPRMSPISQRKSPVRASHQQLSVESVHSNSSHNFSSVSPTLDKENSMLKKSNVSISRRNLDVMIPSIPNANSIIASALAKASMSGSAMGNARVAERPKKKSFSNINLPPMGQVDDPIGVRSKSPLSPSILGNRTFPPPEKAVSFTPPKRGTPSSRALSPSSENFEDEVDALLNWTDMLMPEGLR